MAESGLFEVDAAGNLTHEKVTAIGGIPVSQIFHTISRYEVAENDAGVLMNDTMWSTYLPILERSGVDCSKHTVLITEQNGTSNANADQRMLHPDILVPIGSDTLQTAISFLDHK